MNDFIEKKANKKSLAQRKLICGVGINDADYVVQPKINGKQITCPYYRKWKNMMVRCYSEKLQQKYPTYKGCTVCKDWLTFTNFKSWMIEQNWKNKHLDKDLKFLDNKIYSPEACLFLTSKINLLMNDHARSRGEFKTGVSWDKRDKKFKAQCNNGSVKRKNLGLFDTEEDARQAYRKYKKKLVLEISSKTENKEIKQYLINYSNSI